MEQSDRTPIIQVTHVTAAYNGTVLLDDLSFDVYPGEVFVILGRSGSGKEHVAETDDRVASTDARINPRSRVRTS